MIARLRLVADGTLRVTSYELRFTVPLALVTVVFFVVRQLVLLNRRYRVTSSFVYNRVVGRR